MYRHEGSLCEASSGTTNGGGGVKHVGEDPPPISTFIRRTSMRDMLNLGDVDHLIEAEEDANDAMHSTNNHRCHGRGIAIPISPAKKEGPIIGRCCLFHLRQYTHLNGILYAK